MNRTTEFIGLFDPVCHLALRGQDTRQLLGGVDFAHLHVQVFRVASRQFHHRIDAGLFQQIGKFFADALDARQIGTIGPS